MKDVSCPATITCRRVHCFHARRPRRACTQVPRKSSARSLRQVRTGDSGFGFDAGSRVGRRGNPASSPPGPVKDARCSESCTGVGLAGRPAFPHRHTPPSPTRERGTSGELACSRRGDRLTSTQSLAYKQPVIVDPHFTYEIRSQAQQGCSFLQTQVLSSPDGKR